MSVFPGPAPNQYTLPPVVGFQKHDITKTRSPAFTMGQRTQPPSRIFPWEANPPQAPPIVVNAPGGRCIVLQTVPCPGAMNCQRVQKKNQMPKYKMTYFDVKGLGEPIRMMLSYMGEDFEDCRFTDDEWPKNKPTTPWGQAPVVEIDGKEVTQSIAITRYLGKEAGLAGANNCEDLQIDSIVDTIHDFRKAIAEYSYDQDEVSKEKRKGPLFKETVPFYLKKLDDHVAKNGGYLANGKLSWGDILFVAISDYLSYMLGFDLCENNPNLKAHKEKVVSIPKIKEWIEKRPVTES